MSARGTIWSEQIKRRECALTRTAVLMSLRISQSWRVTDCWNVLIGFTDTLYKTSLPVIIIWHKSVPVQAIRAQVVERASTLPTDYRFIRIKTKRGRRSIHTNFDDTSQITFNLRIQPEFQCNPLPQCELAEHSNGIHECFLPTVLFTATSVAFHHGAQRATDRMEGNYG